MYKLSYQNGSDWSEYCFEPIFTQSITESGSARIVAGVPQGDPSIFERLTLTSQPPYILLYILHTPRGEGDAGRYQSNDLSREELSSFISHFRDYFCGDARFDIWAYSPTDKTTVVWDRHNQLFAYGKIEGIVAELKEIGYRPGNPIIPTPHQHHYRQEFDVHAREVLSALTWSYSPLRPEDEQWKPKE